MEQSQAPHSLTHPEEMYATVELNLGGGKSMLASARTTPAGLITAGIMVSAILLSAAALVRASRRIACKHTPPP